MPSPPFGPRAQPDSTIIVGDESAAYCGCGVGEIISAIINPVYGNPALGCNSTDSYRFAGRC